MRYIRNYFQDRPLLQAQYRDNHPTVADLKRLHEAGELTPYQSEHWFGMRPPEELYDLAADPHQINNLASDPAYRAELKHHRQLLFDWMQETDDQGQYPEDPAQLKSTFDLWIDREIFSETDVNPEYDQFR